MQPKAHAGLFLHTIAEEMNIKLKMFWVFSSVTSLLGTVGQTNYGAANRVLDALVTHRRALGMPALAVQWGPWGDFGMATGVDLDRQVRRGA